MYKYLNYQTGILSLAFLIVSLLFTSSVLAATSGPLKVIIASKSGNYKPGDVLKISWTPATTIVQDIGLISNKKNEMTTYYINGDYFSDEQIITGGSFNYMIQDGFVPTGSYYVTVKVPGEPPVEVKSAKTIKIQSRPIISFGKFGRFTDSISVTPGESIKLTWDAVDAKKCKTSSNPVNSTWNKKVSLSGNRTIKIKQPTIFYLTCKNKFGEATTKFTVDIKSQT